MILIPLSITNSEKARIEQCETYEDKIKKMY